MRKPLAIIILMYFFIMPCVLAMGETDVYQIQNGEDDVIMTETLALDTDGPYIILKDYDISYKIGLRFTNITIKRGETITEAILSVYCKYDFPNGTGTVTIYGLKVADAPVLDDPEDLNGPLTENYVIWNISDVKGPDKWHNVTITPIIQEIVNQYGWESGNSLALIILSEKGNIRRQFTSADYMNPAKLYITITPPTPPEENYELITTYKGYEIYNVTVGGVEYVNFLEFDEVDPEDELTRYQYKFEWTDLDLDGGDAYITKYFGDNYFDDFIHNFTLYFSSITASGTYGIIDFWDVNNDNKVFGSNCIRVNAKATLSGNFTIVMNKVSGGSLETNWVGSYEYSTGIPYYFTIIKNGTKWRCIVYSDESRTTILEDSGYITINDDSYSYLSMGMIDQGVTKTYSSGYLENLWIGGEAAPTEWWIEIWENGTQVNGNFTSLEDAIKYIDNELIGPEEEPYNPEVGGYDVIPRRIVKLSYLVSGLGLMMMGLIAISYKPTLGRAIMGILMIVLAMGLLIHLTQI